MDNEQKRRFTHILTLARNEIGALRRDNEILSAQMRVVEIFGTVSGAIRRTGAMHGEDVLATIAVELLRLEKAD